MLNKIFKALLGEPILLGLYRFLTKKESIKIKRMGVGYHIDTKEFFLFYNRDFVDKITNEQLLEVFKHEFYHFVLGHMTYRGNDMIPLIWQFACDLCVNEFCDKKKFPKPFLSIGQGNFKDFPPNKSAEFYYELILKTIPKEQIQILSPQIEEHNWQNQKDVSSKLQSQQIVKKVLREGSKFGGTISRDVLQSLLKETKPKENLSFVLELFFGSITTESETTYTKINHKCPYKMPGERINYCPNIAISVDQSISISKEQLEKFFALLKTFIGKASFTIIPFDTQIDFDNIQKVDNYSTVIDTIRTKKGGTNFDIVTQYVNSSNNFDGHIIFTDMQGQKPIKSKCQRIWITCKDAMFETSDTVVRI